MGSVEMNAKCPCCGSGDLEWDCQHATRSGVADGRLRMNEIQTVFVLGCISCSTTMSTLDGDAAAALLPISRCV